MLIYEYNNDDGKVSKILALVNSRIEPKIGL
jgi:hypothetical protein